MGQPDHRHFRRHHRVRGDGDLFQRFQQHLPHPRKDPHRQFGGHGLTAAAFVGADRRIFGRVGRDLYNADPVADLSQIAKDGHGVSPIRILRAKFGERLSCLTPQDHVEKVEHTPPVGKAQHRANLISGRLASTVADGLVEE